MMRRLEASKEVPMDQRLLCSAVSVIREETIKVKKVKAGKEATKTAVTQVNNKSKKIKKRKKKPTKDERKILKLQRKAANAPK